MSVFGRYKPASRTRFWLIAGLAIALLVAGAAAYAWLTEDQKAAAPSGAYRVEAVVQDLSVPWAITFTNATRMVVTERGGNVRVIERGELQAAPLVVFDETSAGSGEKGLMGLAKDPDYEQNKYLYVCLTYQNAGREYNKVVRFSDQPGGGQRTTILGSLPAADNHVGCRVKTGPDQKLYISLGDAQSRSLSQDIGSLAGKILRINTDGSIPADNPFENSPVWSYGHRNPQGFDWQPKTGMMIATEHGPGSDGPPGGDEINRISKGGNYGWPLVSHDQTREGTVAPLLTFTPAVAPSAGLFYGSSKLPQFTGNYFFGMLRGEGLHRLVFDTQDTSKIIAHEDVSGVDAGRIREVVEGPDGAIYFAASNRDGRGDPREGDDMIYRIVPRE